MVEAETNLVKTHIIQYVSDGANLKHSVMRYEKCISAKAKVLVGLLFYAENSFHKWFIQNVLPIFTEADVPTSSPQSLKHLRLERAA